MNDFVDVELTITKELFDQIYAAACFRNMSFEEFCVSAVKYYLYKKIVPHDKILPTL